MSDEFTKNLQKLEGLIAEAKDVVREGNAMLKDMKYERKAFEELQAHTKREMTKWLDSSVDSHITPVLEQSFSYLEPQIKELYNGVASQVKILTKPLELVQALLKQNERDISAICATLDKVESSGILEELRVIVKAEQERRAHASQDATGASRAEMEKLMEEMAKDGVEVHRFTAEGHIEYVWDEELQQLRMKDASDE